MEQLPALSGEDYAVYSGDCRTALKNLPDASVNCCVTSPPYWGLRDYGTASWENGSASCLHDMVVSDDDCLRCETCGAIKVDRQIGLEKTPDEFVSEMVTVFREVRRTLRDDGVLWLNLGDSYAGNNSRASNNGRAGFGNPRETVTSRTGEGLKTKDLVGIPWMVALALRNDGWYLRQDIIWHKPNPLPESVRDRCTKSHEYIFLLSKSPQYYFDAEAIKEPSSNLGATKIRFGGNKYGDSTDPKHATKSGNAYTDTGTRNKRSVWTVPTRPYKGSHFAVFPPDLIEPCILAGCPKGGVVLDPFGGSGTTIAVSLLNDRRGVAVELNPDYLPLIQRRIDEAIEAKASQANQLSLFEELL